MLSCQYLWYIARWMHYTSIKNNAQLSNSYNANKSNNKWPRHHQCNFRYTQLTPFSTLRTSPAAILPKKRLQIVNWGVFFITPSRPRPSQKLNFGHALHHRIARKRKNTTRLSSSELIKICRPVHVNRSEAHKFHRYSLQQCHPRGAFVFVDDDV